MRAALGVALALLVSATPAFANSPEALAVRFLDAMIARDYQAVAELTHPDALREVRESLGFIPNLDERKQKVALTGFFGPDATMESFGALSDAEVYAALMTLAMTKDDWATLLAAGDSRVSGTVADADDVVRVLVQIDTVMQRVDATLWMVVSCRRANDRYLLLAREEVEFMVSLFKKASGAT